MKPRQASNALSSTLELKSVHKRAGKGHPRILTIEKYQCHEPFFYAYNCCSEQ
jgi:hypothetical protein